MDFVMESALIKRVFDSKDHFEVLGVSKDAQIEDIRTAYKRLALSLHPDKNLAPGAEEAFKRVSVAYEVLADHKKRQRYVKETKFQADKSYDFAMYSTSQCDDTEDSYWNEIILLIGMSAYIFLSVHYLTKLNRSR